MRFARNSRVFKTVLGVTAAAALMLPLAACSSDASGNDKPKPVAQVDNLSGQSTSVLLDQGFVDALTSLKLTPGVVGDAKLAGGSVSFPITGGNVTYYKPGSIDPYVQGIIAHDGSGLSLTAGDTTAELTNFEVDPGTSKLYGDVSVNGESAAKHAFIFALDGRTLKPLQTKGDTAILEGAQVKVSDDAAGLLNKTFKTDAVKGGLLVGTAKITISTK
ncbi:MAG: hypothetical protein H0T17_03260 [Propionibacteriales bacterium]|nr:hypothetical protein [Propionibacteriales bacterium]